MFYYGCRLISWIQLITGQFSGHLVVTEGHSMMKNLPRWLGRSAMWPARTVKKGQRICYCQVDIAAPGWAGDSCQNAIKSALCGGQSAASFPSLTMAV